MILPLEALKKVGVALEGAVHMPLIDHDAAKSKRMKGRFSVSEPVSRPLAELPVYKESSVVKG